MESLSKNDKLSDGISGKMEISRVVVEIDLVSDEVDDELLMRFLLTGVLGELLPIDKGGELGEQEEVEELLILVQVTTSDREGVNRVSPKRSLLLLVEGISTELLRERDGVGGSVDGRRDRLLVVVLSSGFLERGCVWI